MLVTDFGDGICWSHKEDKYEHFNFGTYIRNKTGFMFGTLTHVTWTMYLIGKNIPNKSIFYRK